MKFISTACAILLAQSASAFAPPGAKAFIGVVSSNGNVAQTQLNMAEDPLPFFAAKPAEEPQAEEAVTETTAASAPIDFDSMTLEEEVEILFQKEVAKTRKVSKLRTAQGVDYAPWMEVSEKDKQQMRQLAREKAAARRKRMDQEKSVSGNLFLDSQAQELSGTGLNTKIIDGEVELEWATKSETNTRGFIVKRRPAKTEEFEVISSFEQWGPLVSKGQDGGVYRYLDTTSTPGGWVYRISECDNNGVESDLCQCLIEVQTEEEQRTALIAGVGIAVLGVSAVVAGLVLDPYAM
jgi:hypothetical protein